MVVSVPSDLPASPPRAAKAPVHLPGLDGIRALAVVGVLLYHGEIPALFPGGFLGVDVFFALSGFLITWLLVREFQGRGSIDIQGFYVRRAKRLLPAAFTLLAATVLLASLLAPDALARLRGDVPAALTYTSNWWQIHTGQSYFEMIGRPPLLQHLWSLAIEEQFYVVWPVVVLLVLRASGARSLAALSVGLAGVVTGWMAWLAVSRGYPADADPSRAYLGTDTHTMGLLLGAAVGSLWTSRPHPGAPGRGVAGRIWPGWSEPSALLLDLAGWASLVAVVAVMARVNEASSALYRGGFLGFAALTLLLVVAAADSRTTLGFLLGLQPMKWIGQRSYGLYLWHWPIFCLARPGHEMAYQPWLAFAVRMALTIVAAELSFRLVEDPIRASRVSRWSWPRKLALSGAFTLGVAAIVAVATRPAEVTRPPRDVAEAIGLPASRSTLAPVVEAPVAAKDVKRAVPVRRKRAPSPAAVQPAGPAMTAIGDSVVLGAEPMIVRSLAGTHVDAEVGRQGSQGLARVKDLRQRGLLAPIVLLHLGTNGFLNESHLRALLQDLSDRKVIVVNVRAPRRWESFNNEMIARVGADFAHVALLDWHQRTEGHDEYFVSDRVHLTAVGKRAFIEAIAQESGIAVAPAGPTAGPATDPALARKVAGSAPGAASKGDSPPGTTPSTPEDERTSL